MKIIIVGGGQVGSYVARLMLDAGNDVTIIENRDKALRFLEKEFSENIVVVGNGADPKIMQQAGIEQADVLASITGTDEINLVTATIAKFEFGVKRVISRVNNPKNDWLFTPAMGVDVKISQASLLANVIADQIDMANIVTLMRLNKGDNAIVNATVTAQAPVVGQALKNINIPTSTVLIAIYRGDTNLVPRGETVLQAGDHVLAYTRTNEEKDLYTLLH